MTRKLEANLPEFEQELAESERRTAALRQIVEGIRALNGDVTLPTAELVPPSTRNGAAVAPGTPRGTTAVELIVSERPGRWTLRELHAEFEERGWYRTADKKKAEATVDSAVYRLWKLGRAKKVKPGVYKFPAPDREEATVESGGPDPGLNGSS